MNKIAIPVIILVFIALVAGGYLLFSGDDPETLDNTLKVTSNEGEFPGAKQIAKDFMEQLERVAKDGSVNFETVKNSSDEVIYKNIAMDVERKRSKKSGGTEPEITNVMIEKARFSDDGTAEISNFLLGEKTEEGTPLAVGVEKASISNYKLKDGLLISIDQSFEGGIAGGERLNEIEDGLAKLKTNLKDQSQALQDLPDEVIASLEDVSGVVNYRYNPELQNLATGFSIDLPSMAALTFSMAVNEVSEENARQMQDSVLFGGSGKNLSENLKDYDFKGILQKARIELRNDGLIDKIFSLAAGFQKPKNVEDIEPIKENLRKMSVALVERYKPKKRMSESALKTLNDLKANIVQLLNNEQDSITLSIAPKEGGIKQTVPQAAMNGFEQYTIKVSD